MSVKTMGLVWDMECPAEINELPFKPGHKYVLLAYADHADHNGRNIYPAILTIARKTGYYERSVQRLTSELEDMGILVKDGHGQHGTTRWYISGAGSEKIRGVKMTGAKIAPVARERGVIPSGVIPSGVIPSDAILASNVNDSPSDLQYVNNIEFSLVWATLKTELQKELTGSQFTKWVEPTKAVSLSATTLTVEVPDELTRDWLTARIAEKAQSKLAGVIGTEEPIRIKFVVPEAVT